MATFKLRKFSQPDALKIIAPELLAAFLKPFENYLEKRGLVLRRDGTLDYDRLVSILVNPDEDIPEIMVDALYFVHEMSDESVMDDLLALAKTRGVALSFNQEPTPADVAIALWQAAPRLLEEKHAEACVLRPRSFEYYAGSTGAAREFPQCDEDQLTAIERRLEEWFVSKMRGKGTKVFIFRQDDKALLLIRHGMTMRREGSLRNGVRGLAYYRPEVHDVVVYDMTVDLLGIRAGTKGEHALYRSVLSEALFGSPSYFAERSDHSLVPLIRSGPEALACEDIPGMNMAKLVEVRRFIGGETKERVVHQSTDLFRTFGEDWHRRLSFGELTGATFEVSLGDATSPRRRRVSLIFPNLAKYDRDDDDARTIELWLRRRGFMAAPKGKDDDHDTVLGTPVDHVVENAVESDGSPELAGASG
jgi:hypothetical protein